MSIDNCQEPRRQGATMPFETNPVEKMIANEPDTILGEKGID